MRLDSFLNCFCKDQNLAVCLSDTSGRELYCGALSEVPEQYGTRRIVPMCAIVTDTLMYVKIYVDERWKEKYRGQYLPVYDEEHKTWIVDTIHGIEYGSVLYVADQFCWDSVVYPYTNASKPDHTHGSFEAVILRILSSPDCFDVNEYKEYYSEQEFRVIYSLKAAISFVKTSNRPLTREDAREIQKKATEKEQL